MQLWSRPQLLFSIHAIFSYHNITWTLFFVCIFFYSIINIWITKIYNLQHIFLNHLSFITTHTITISNNENISIPTNQCMYISPMLILDSFIFYFLSNIHIYHTCLNIGGGVTKIYFQKEIKYNDSILHITTKYTILK